MSWTDQELKSTYRRGLEGGPAAAAACPDEDALERFLLGTLEPAERDRLADHLEGCAACAELVQKLDRLSAWAERAAAVRRPARGFRRFRAPLAALAAVLVLAVAGPLIWTRVLEPGAIEPPAGAARRAPADAVIPPPGSALAAAPTGFDWPDEPGAAGYRLRLFGPAADLLWESELLIESDCPLPAPVAAHLAAGSRYSWTVAVEGPARRRELGPFGFEIEPR